MEATRQPANPSNFSGMTGDQSDVSVDQAFEAIYRDHHRRVHAVALRLMRDPVAAEEVTQDVFVEAWKALPRFRGDASLETWLHRIAVHRALNQLRGDRRRVARVETTADLEQFMTAARQAMPDTDLLVEEAVARLPEGARTVLILYEIEGYTYLEIAEMLDVSIGTVRSQLHRARALLMEVLDDGT